MKQKFINWVWAIIWFKYMEDWKGRKLRVILVKGWRTAIVQNYAGTRQTITPCFKILWFSFD